MHISKINHILLEMFFNIEKKKDISDNLITNLQYYYKIK